MIAPPAFAPFRLGNRPGGLASIRAGLPAKQKKPRSPTSTTIGDAQVVALAWVWDTLKKIHIDCDFDSESKPTKRYLSS